MGLILPRICDHVPGTRARKLHSHKSVKQAILASTNLKTFYRERYRKPKLNIDTKNVLLPPLIPGDGALKSLQLFFFVSSLEVGICKCVPTVLGVGGF